MSTSGLNIALDEDTLITEVQCRPILWDPADKFHRKKQSLQKAWDDLAQSVFPDLEEFPTSKQKEILSQIRLRWHHLRSMYRSSLMKGGDCPHAARLTFLDKCYPELASALVDGPPPLGRMPGRDDSAAAGASRVRQTAKKRPYCRKKNVSFDAEGPQRENYVPASTTRLYDPKLSLTKVDQRTTHHSPTDRPPSSAHVEHASFLQESHHQQQQQLQKSPPQKRKYPLHRKVCPWSSSETSDDDVSEDCNNDDEELSNYSDDEELSNYSDDESKSCKLSYAVRMASSPGNERRRGQTSAFATLSFRNENGFNKRRKSAPASALPPPPSSDYYRENGERCHPKRAMRAGSSSSHVNAAVHSGAASAQPPPALRAHESWPDNHSSMLPAVPVDYNDEDMSFFRSLLTWTKRFNEDQKLEFRSEIMKLVSRMRNGETGGNYYVISQTSLR